MSQVMEPIVKPQPKRPPSFWATYQWVRDGDEWSDAFGGTAALWQTIILPRIHEFIPAGHILEIAPGHGRCTQFLRNLCRHLTIVDLIPECVEACRKRFDDDPAITFASNDGRTLPMVKDGSIDFAFSWDSLVHVEAAAIRSYVFELARCLKPGAYGWLHHSNLHQHDAEAATLDEGRDLHGRARDSSAAKVREACREAGLRCVSQELLPWGSTGLFLDCISVVQRVSGTDFPETVIKEHTGWRTECANSQHIGRLYRRA